MLRHTLLAVVVAASLGTIAAPSMAAQVGVSINVGHYGVFSGKRWQNHIYPVVRDVIHVSQ